MIPLAMFDFLSLAHLKDMHKIKLELTFKMVL